MEAEAEGALLTAWRDRGDRGAFESLILPWLPPIRRMIYFHVGDDPELFDEVQSEVLVGLMTALRGFRGQAALKTFLFTIVRRKSADAVRRRRRTKPHFSWDEDLEGPDGSPDPSHKLIQEEKERLLHAAVARLPEVDRAIIHLRLLEGVSETEAAAVLGMKPATLRSRLDRARKKLRARLSEEAGEE